MKRARSIIASAVVAPALVSCAFVLDFDSLQKEKDTPGQGGQLLTGGTGATGGNAGTGGDTGTDEAGAAGSGGCSSSCFDDDPCTTDGCDDQGECLSGVSTGLILDDIDQTVPADLHYRVTAVAGDDDFFLSAFSESADGPALTLYRVAAEGIDFSDIGTFTGLTPGDFGEPASAAGLAFQQGAGLLHAFIAMKTLTGSSRRVRHLIINGETFEMLGAGALVSESYWDVSPFNYPVALTLGAVPAVAWINEDQTIGLDGGGLQQEVTLSAATQATSLALVASDGEEPVVLYGTASDGVFLERPGFDPQRLVECQTAEGDYLSFATAFSSVPGYWLGAWTIFAAATDEEEGFLTTEGAGMFCGGDSCTVREPDCGASSRNNLARNPATAVVHRPGTRAGLVEVVQATPLVGPGEEPDTIVAGIALTQESVDLGVPPFATDATSEPLGPPFALSTQETSEESGYRGPDWPVIAHVPPDRYLVAWIEPAEQGDSLRVQRYRMCVP